MLLRTFVRSVHAYLSLSSTDFNHSGMMVFFLNLTLLWLTHVERLQVLF
jgi:hypothetical protein